MVEILDRFYPTETYGALIASLPQKHARPKGSILLIETAKDVIGCGMIQPMNGDDAEIKRVYIEDAAQGLGAGKQLSNALIAQALADGYKRILLDTSKISTAAQGLYESLGFKKRGPYSEMPADMIEVLVFYEFEL
ncbi:MAG: GNAT family N-acetyltransferase [Pseudomonadota bacterium]